jgi:hypothetical protein
MWLDTTNSACFYYEIQLDEVTSVTADLNHVKIRGGVTEYWRCNFETGGKIEKDRRSSMDARCDDSDGADRFRKAIQQYAELCGANFGKPDTF